MRRLTSLAHLGSALGVLSLGATLTSSCGAPLACPAVGYVSSMTLHITPERTATLATLGIELCQDGTCHRFSIDALAPLTPGPIPPPTSPGAPRAVPERKADGSIEVRIEAIKDSPINLTTSGTSTSGSSIGTSQTTLHPTTTYPHGHECGGATTASATLDPLGLKTG